MRGANLKFAGAKLTGLPLEKALPSELKHSRGLFFYSQNVICVKADKQLVQLISKSISCVKADKHTTYTLGSHPLEDSLYTLHLIFFK